MPHKTRPTRVLLTGGWGFVGQNVYAYLKENRPDWWIGRFKHSTFDLTRWDETQALMKAAQPDYVVHLAARCGGIGANMKSPADYWASNLAMAINLLDACAIYCVGKVVMLGTVCSYPRDATPPFNEDALCTGWPEITNRPYGIAKLAMYEGCRAYALQHDLKYSFLIPTNMYGPFDNLDLETSHVIPAMIRKFAEAVVRKEETVTLWGDGTPTRDFLHVRDAASAIDACFGKETGGGPINLGGGQEVSMRALAEMVAHLTGYKGEIVWDTSLPNGQPRRAVDASRAKSILGWEPKIPLLDGLKETYEYVVRSNET